MRVFIPVCLFLMHQMSSSRWLSLASGASSPAPHRCVVLDWPLNLSVPWGRVCEVGTDNDLR